MSILKYRADIDGLRAVAILPVLLFHAGISSFSGGFVGVDIFFVISGFLITSIIIREVDQQQNFSFASFWARRARRILPALAVVVFATLIAGWFLLGPIDYRDLGVSTRFQAFFASNFHFWQSSGYFDGPSELKPLLHTWSLAVEEQFYLFFPLLFVALTKLGRKRRHIALWIIAVASLLGSIWYLQEDVSATFYLLPTRAWELLTGSLLALSLTQSRNVSSGVANGVASIGLIAILVSVFAYDKYTVFPAQGALLPVLGAAAIIWANSYANTWVARVLSQRVFVFIGLISYSLYLWHWPIMAFYRYRFGEEISGFDQVLVIGLSFLMAYVSLKLVEDPVRKGKLFRKNLVALLVGLLILLIMYGAGQSIRKNDGFAERLPAEALHFFEAGKNPFLIKCGQNENHEFHEFGCMIGGSADEVPDLVIMGDSHTGVLGPLIEELSESTSTSVLLATNAACLPNLEVELPGQERCYEYTQRILKYFDENNIETVMLAVRWLMYIRGVATDRLDVQLFDPLTGERNKERAKEMFERVVSSTIDQLSEGGRKIWLMQQVPEQSYRVPRYLANVVMRGEPVEQAGELYSEHRANFDFVDRVLMAQEEKGAKFIETESLFCNQERCSMTKDGDPLYLDHNHVSVTGALLLKPAVEQVFMSLKEG